MENQIPNPPERPQQPPPVYHHPYEKPPHNPFEKTPFLAGILSVVPGLGNVYNGLYLRGLAFALVCIGLFLIAILEDAPPLIPFIIFFWLFNVIDAYRQAMLINYGARSEELDPTRRPEWQSSGGMILGVALSLVGAYGLITKLFPSFDLSELLEYWWVAFLVLGPWLIYKTLQEHGRKDDGPEARETTSSTPQDAGEREAA